MPILFILHQEELDPLVVLVPAFLLAVSLLFWATAAMMLGGKVVVKVEGNSGRIFVGVGPLGWKRNFNWSEVSGFRQQDAKWHGPGCSGMQIVAEEKRESAFGSMLDGRRRLFLLGMLRQMLAKRNSGQA